MTNTADSDHSEDGERSSTTRSLRSTTLRPGALRRVDWAFPRVAAVVGLTAAAATIGFHTVFSDWSFLIAALVAGLTAAVVFAIGRQLRLLTGEKLALALLAPAIVGPLACRGTGFFTGVTTSWNDVLTSTPPLTASPARLAAPFLIAYFGSCIGCELASRPQLLSGLAIAGPLTTLGMASMLSRQSRGSAMFVGVALLVGVLTLIRFALDSHSAEVDEAEVSAGAGGLRSGSPLLGLLSLAVLAGVVITIAPAVVRTPADGRATLRDLREPLWNPLDLPSPLTTIKAPLKQASPDEIPLFRVSGAVASNRWRLAALPSYNGEFWSVAEADSNLPFIKVDEQLPRVSTDESDAEPNIFTVDVLQAMEHWIPTPGSPRRVAFEEPFDVRMSLATATLGSPSTLQPGRYEVEVNPWPVLSPEELSAVTFVADNADADLELLPSVVRNLAGDFTTGLPQLSGARVLAIQANLRLGSYDLETAPGHAFGRVGGFLEKVPRTPGRVSNDPESLEALRSLVAYEELYAASAAVLIRLSDIPARVAVGYVIDDARWENGSADVRASDMSAWVEVEVSSDVWLPVDVVPDKSRQPEEVPEGTDTLGVPVADPPREPPPPQDEERPEITDPTPVPTPEVEEEELLDSATDGRVTVVAVAVVSLLFPFLFLLTLGALAAMLKRRRRRRRRSAQSSRKRAAGAWAELQDRLLEMGFEVPPAASPSEVAATWRSAPANATGDADDLFDSLALRASEAAFHPNALDAAHAEVAWLDYDAAAASLASAASRSERIKRSVDPRPLVGRGSRRS